MKEGKKNQENEAFKFYEFVRDKGLNLKLEITD
jgi:hypothetical protein